MQKPTSDVMLGKTAGSDISVGYAADNFLARREPCDPWNEQCFVSIVDVVVNHPVAIFPHPTPSSVVRSARLPRLFRELMKRSAVSDPDTSQVPLLKSFTANVASEMRPGSETLRETLRDFIVFTLEEREKLNQWISFQESIRPKHIVGIPGEVQQFTAEFWNELTPGELPVGLLNIEPNRLRYAFDVFFRGRQYIELLANTESLYVPHPIRMRLFSRSKQDSRATRLWSWGGVIAILIASKRFSRRPDEVADLVGRIKSTVATNRLSWYDHPDEARLKEAAAIMDLPAVVRKEFFEVMRIVTKVPVGALDLYLKTFGLITLTTELLIVKLKSKDRYVRGGLGKFSLLRGYIDWPGADYYRRDIDAR